MITLKYTCEFNTETSPPSIVPGSEQGDFQIELIPQPGQGNGHGLTVKAPFPFPPGTELNVRGSMAAQDFNIYRVSHDGSACIDNFLEDGKDPQVQLQIRVPLPLKFLP